jgi:peptidoglycan/LPS O-acetylase OafA/YrhL
MILTASSREVLGVESSFASLDLLRGLSAGAVLLSHIDTFVASGKALLPGFLGSTAVEVFMMISGFLMMWHFQVRREKGEAWDSPKTYLNFYVRRFFRIAPLYYLMLVLVYSFHGTIGEMSEHNRAVFAPTYLPGSHDPTDSALSVAHVVSHFTFVFGLIPRFAQSNPLPDWSIGLEMQFYLLFPFIALLLVRSRYLGAVILLLAIKWASLRLFGVGVMSEPKMLGLFPYPTLLAFKIDCFLVGMLIAAGLYERDHAGKSMFLLLLALVVAGLHMKKLLLVGFAFTFFEISLRHGTGWDRCDQLLKRINGLLGGRFTKFLADTSYGVYLIHIPLLILLVWLLTKYTGFESYSPVMRLAVMTAVISPLVYLLGYLAFRFVESPGIDWGRRVIGGRKRPS